MSTTSISRPTLERRRHATAAPPMHRGMLGAWLRDTMHRLILDPRAPKGQRTPTVDDWRWYDLTRAQPRLDMPCIEEVLMIDNGIRAGCITRDALLDYTLAKLTHHLAQFPDAGLVSASTVLYVRLMAEQAEALEAQATARGVGSRDAIDAAVRETEDAIGIEVLYVAHERQMLEAR